MFSKFNLIPLPYKILGAVIGFLLIVGISFSTGYSVRDMSCKATALALELETVKATNALQLELFNASANATTQYRDRVVPIYIERERNSTLAGTVPDKGQLSTGWVYLHDQAALQTRADANSVSDPTPSGTQADQALGIVTNNYGTCNAIREQLIALQKFNADAEVATSRGSKPKTKGVVVP